MKPTLATRLAATSAGLVLAVSAAVAAAGYVLLGRLADEQARARVELAAAVARQEVAAEAGRVATAARLLAQRPTLARLLAEGRTPELEAFLSAFCDTSALERCGVTGSGGVATGFEERLPEAPTDGAGVIAEAGELVVLAAAPLPAAPARRAVVASRLDRRFVQLATAKIGLPVSFRPVAPGTPAQRAAHRLDDAYLASQAIAGPDGQPVGTVEVAQSAAPFTASLGRFGLTLLGAAVTAAGLALAVGWALGRRLAAPARDLAAAARRIGDGDLATPVAGAAGVEMGRLARTLEEMRRQLLAATSELRGREAELTTVLEGVVEGVIAVDEARRVTYLNPEAARWLGLAPEAVVGAFCGDLLRPELVEGRLPCHDDCPIVHARSRGPTRAVEHLRPAHVAPRTVVITSAPPTAGHQVLVLRDETDEETARRVRDAILANLSHELKTPLAAQLASIELLQDGLEHLPPQDARELVDSLERSTLRLTRLIDNLLASARLEAGEWPMRVEAVAAVDVGREAAGLLAPLFEQRGQRLAWDAEVDLPPVAADRAQLAQVFVNLLANANKFAPDETTIRIVGRRDAGRVALTVEDEGPGLPPDDGRDLFARYERRPRGNVDAPGAGLGLWIVRTIVERHGGSVMAETRREGGARFTVILPAAREEAA